jgi:hypothetical protein
MNRHRSMARSSYSPVSVGRVNPRLSCEAVRDENGKVVAIKHDGKITYLNVWKPCSSGRIKDL